MTHLPEPKVGMPPQSEGILESSLYIEDVAVSVKFYERIFGFRIISDFGERGCATVLVRLDGDRIEQAAVRRGDDERIVVGGWRVAGFPVRSLEPIAG